MTTNSYITTVPLTPNTAYKFTVTSTNAFGESTTSNIVSVVVGLATVPTAPLTLANDAAVTASGIVGLIWFAPASDGGSPVIDYQVSSKIGSGAYSVLASDITSKSYTTSSLTSGVIYTFKVAARNAIGLGADSTEFYVRATAIPSVPATPTTAISGINVAITWVAPENGGSAITAYTVSIKKSDGTFTSTSCNLATISCTASCTCSVTIAALQAMPFSLAVGASVSAKVLATNAVGSSVSSG